MAACVCKHCMCGDCVCVCVHFNINHKCVCFHPPYQILSLPKYTRFIYLFSNLPLLLKTQSTQREEREGGKGGGGKEGEEGRMSEGGKDENRKGEEGREG